MNSKERILIYPQIQGSSGMREDQGKSEGSPLMNGEALWSAGVPPGALRN